MLAKPYISHAKPAKKPSSAKRVSLWYGVLMGVFALFVVRLFYLQVLRHDFYQKVALSGQLKQYEIPAERGTIRAQDGTQLIPLVLNEKRYNVIADPKLIHDYQKTAELLSPAIGRSVEEIKVQLQNDSRYEILAKKLTKEQHEKVKALDLLGVFEDEVAIRTYPQGELAAQVLGFVDDNADGKYGIEQYMHDTLAGTPGQLKAITDQKGVPLLANSDNILKDPIDGQDVVLTIDVGMQRQVEDLLKTGVEAAKSKSGSALILDANTGAIKAMANYPTYNPGEFSKVTDASLFLNANVSTPLEVGSIMKPLVAAAAMQQGVVNKNTTYFDPSRYQIGDAVVTNIEEDGGAGTKSVQDILQLSLNTGATWLLMQMGGGDLNEKGRVAWYEFMTKQYGFGALTGIEQGNEVGGTVPDPKEGDGLNIRYANTAFGQGMMTTTLQMGAALASVVNGGTYYRPHLVEKTVTKEGKETPAQNTVLRTGVVSSQVSQDIIAMMQYVVEKNNRPAVREGYIVGGKTGTAEIAKPAGAGYYDDRFNGTYLGFVGGVTPQYVIVVRVNEPKIAGYAGSQAAAPLFSNISNMLINNFNISQ